MNSEERRRAKFRRRYRFGDAPRVFIFCDSPKHSQRILVEEFERQNQAEQPFWHPTLHGGESQEHLIRDVPFMKAPPSPDPGRFRYRLKCRRCGYEVDVREEKLAAVLDRLTLGGVSQVSLRGLSCVI